uniref:SRCR domain-containing protein n=1 Tax=Oryzias latipes TaxID=8090 RepID=A0A3P9JRF1_ORYLA
MSTRRTSSSLLLLFLLILCSGAVSQDDLLTRASCGRVFCSPWQRCIDGVCSCKPPYMCPRDGVKAVCTRNHKRYLSYCQVTHAVRTQGCVKKFSSSIDKQTGVVKLFLPDGGEGEELLVCHGQWNMAAANVACREEHNDPGLESM